MPSKTLTRSHICAALCDEANLTRQQSIEVLETVLASISDGLADEGQVKISSFGTFQVRHKIQRVGRNPKTGQEVPIPPRKSLSFKASHSLKNCVNC